jgi:hypothetical protein
LCEALESRVLLVIPGTTLGVWDTYNTLTQELTTIRNTYPNLTRLISVGKTVQQKDIWAMQITDNPGVQEDEPEFLYNGPMHGDEAVGMELSFYFIQHLLESYGTGTGDGPRITNLVNNMDIWIIPSMNWDGYMWGGGGPSNARRGNANNVDLNRNFPEWTTLSHSQYTVHFGPYGNVFDGPAHNTSGLQAETVAIMNFRASHRFVASSTFHGGTLGALYSWGSNNNQIGDYATPPEDALWREMASTYARQNPPMFANDSFPFTDGISNSDYMYPVTGGLMDWSTLYLGSFEATMELSHTKYPPANQLPTFWNQNRESMLQYMEIANWGVRGFITDANTGAPLAAKVTMTSPPSVPTPDPNHPSVLSVFSDGAMGDYHRILLPGTYTLKFEAPGYQTQTISNIVVGSKTTNPNNTLRRDVQLVPIDTVPPSVQNGAFHYTSAPQSVRYTFSENVSASLDVSDLLLENLTTGQTIPSGNIAVSYASGTNVATFSFPGYEYGVLPNGAYRATLLAAGVTDPAGNPLPANHVLNFFFLQGDADHDNDIDGDDYFLIDNGFNTGLGGFENGDFNYDGVIDGDDYAIIDLAFNTQ